MTDGLSSNLTINSSSANTATITLDSGLASGDYTYQVKCVAHNNNYDDKAIVSDPVNLQIINPTDVKNDTGTD
jgi:hypothetical protein